MDLVVEEQDIESDKGGNTTKAKEVKFNSSQEPSYFPTPMLSGSADYESSNGNNNVIGKCN